MLSLFRFVVCRFCFFFVCSLFACVLLVCVGLSCLGLWFACVVVSVCSLFCWFVGIVFVLFLGVFAVSRVFLFFLGFVFVPCLPFVWPLGWLLC